MRVGISVGYWPWFTYEEQLEMAMLADELHLDSVWVSEAWGQDVVSMLGMLAARTEHVDLGTAIMQIPARKPTAAAMAAATLDVISGGRVRLGLGPSGPQVSEGWYGEPFAKPLARTRAYVDVIRRALAGETLPVQVPEGQGSGLGKPLRILARPVREKIPIYLGATAPKAIEQCGEIADGWIGFLIDPEHPQETVGAMLDAVRAAGRPVEEFDLCALTPTAVADSEDEALELVRPWIAFYLGAMGAKGKNFYVELAARMGHGEGAAHVQDLYLAGDREGAAAAVPRDFLAAVTIATTPDLLAARLQAYEAAGVTTVISIPCGDHERTITALAEASQALQPVGSNG